LDNNTQKSIADSLEVTNLLLPHMPYLLQDLWVLGSSADQILELLLNLPLNKDSTSVLDLGCGKGAISIQIASRFGFSTTGVDALHEFIEDAKNKAADYNVSHICKFIEADMRDFIKDINQFDIAILASLGGIFGNNIDTVKKMRTQVKPGGFMIIDDGYFKNKNTVNREGYEHYRNHKKTVEEITSFNDQLIAEISTTANNININYDYLVAIEKRAIELINKFPGLETEIKNYIDLQREECEFLDKEIEGMIWLLKKTTELTEDGYSV